MARYRMDDGTVVDTERRSASWEEARDHDGHNFVGRSSGSQWNYQKLYRSRKGRYYLVHHSQWQGSRDYAEWISNHEAARWLLHNDAELPKDLAALEDEVVE